MLVLNFSHPLTTEQREQVTTLCGEPIDRVIEAPAQFDHAREFIAQATELVESTGLSAAAWQTERLLVVPPSLAAIACLVVAEIHGRAGYFPPLIRISPQAGKVPPVYEVCEILDLAGVRERARLTRQ